MSRQGSLTAMGGSAWSDGYEAWKRLRRWHERGTADGDAALDALSDIGALRRLLDQAELSAVRAARGRAKSWAEIATRLGVTRQSAWERWRDLDDIRPATEEVATGLWQATEEAATELVAAALDGPLVVVPDVTGLEWETARRVLASARLVAVSADPDGPPLRRRPTAGSSSSRSRGRASGWSRGRRCRLWLGRGPGDAGVREPLHPRPTPRATGGAIDETTGRRSRRRGFGAEAARGWAARRAAVSGGRRFPQRDDVDARGYCHPSRPGGAEELEQRGRVEVEHRRLGDQPVAHLVDAHDGRVEPPLTVARAVPPAHGDMARRVGDEHFAQVVDDRGLEAPPRLPERHRVRVRPSRPW